jgi:hypothetical protein
MTQIAAAERSRLARRTARTRAALVKAAQSFIASSSVVGVQS